MFQPNDMLEGEEQQNAQNVPWQMNNDVLEGEEQQNAQNVPWQMNNDVLEGEEQQNAQNVPWQMSNTTLEREIPSNKHGSNNNRGSSSSSNGRNQSLSGRKNPNHRHTQSQINALEALFKECPRPDDKQRRELAQQLSLEPLQVKFWFQNKRTQMKNHHDRHESTNLRTENELLRMENKRYKEALSSMMCHTCSGPITIGETSYNEEQLRLENTRLREEENQRISAASKNVGKRMLPQCSRAPRVPSHASLEPPTRSIGTQVGMSAEMYEAAEILQSMPSQPDPDKQMIVEIVVVAMDELVRMATLGQPLWTPADDGSTEIICYEEYVRTFTRGNGLKRFGMISEVTRETAVLAMNHINLVEILMNVNQWASVFSTIISKAVIMDVLVASDGGNYNGALQVMSAEFQVPSPLVPVRESYFARFCKQHGDGKWVVVDVSLDSVYPGPLERSRRRPSGCVIQEMPNGHSKVTWVEHVEVDHKKVHPMYKPVAGLGRLLFGAKRWIATLDRQCERLAIVMASGNLGGDGVITSQEGRKSMLKLAERMVTSSFTGVRASTAHSWTSVSGNCSKDVRIMMKRSSDDPGRPSGVILSASTSLWLPLPHKRVFDYLRSENSRNKWDIHACEGPIEEMTNFENGREPGNSVSLLRINSSDPNKTNMLMLQECRTDPTGSFLIYAPVGITSVNMVLNGGDPDNVAILPSGFSLFPDDAGRSLLTVAYQILVDSIPTATLPLSSVMTVNRLTSATVEKMKALITANA